MGLFRQLALLGAFARLSLGQDCPILGPAYPEVISPTSSSAFSAAKRAFDEELTKALAVGQLDNKTTFAIQVFSRHSDEILYERYHGPSIGPETVYRIGSISKLVSVYTTLVGLSDKHWNDPVTNHVPELAELKPQNPVYNINWSEVTLGALASQMGGIPLDYAQGDLSPFIPPGTPGLPSLNDSEAIRCGTTGFRACTRAESFAKIQRAVPISPTYHTPAYSNMAFQLLGYAVEKITGQPFATLVEEKLLKPLKLGRTFLTKPTNDSNALILDGWDQDVGDEAPAGGYYSTASDLTKLGRSILSSTLLPAQTTRAWLKPTTHTASLTQSVGRPWEILRLAVLASPSSSASATRVVDLYTKLGALGQYTTLLALSPAHGLGFSLLVGGPAAGASFGLLQRRMSEVWLGLAAEQAGKEHVAVNYAGNYTLAGDESVAELGVNEAEPGLVLKRLVSNGTDVFGLLAPLVAPIAGAPGEIELGAWLYPMGLQGGQKVAFRALMGVKGLPAGMSPGPCSTLDLLRYGGYPLDLFIFELGENGKAVAVEVPVLKKTLRREG